MELRLRERDDSRWQDSALIDECTRECLAIRVARRLGSQEVIEALADVMLMRGIPEYLRFDNGPEFVAGNRFLNGVAGQLNGIATMTSGTPYDVTVSGDIANTGGVVERANPTPSHWLNASAFAVPANYAFGNLDLKG